MRIILSGVIWSIALVAGIACSGDVVAIDNPTTTPVMSSIDRADDAITLLEERIAAQDEEIVLLRAELELIAQVTASAVAEAGSASVVRVNPPDYGPQIATLSSQLADLAVRPTASVEIIGYDDLLRRVADLEDMAPEEVHLILADINSLDRRATWIEQDLKSLERSNIVNEERIYEFQKKYELLDTAIEQLSALVGDPRFLPARDPFRVSNADNAIQHDTIIDWITTATELINWIHIEYGKASRQLGILVDEEYPIKQQ